MSSGEFIADRWLVQALREICASKNITFRSFSNDWLLELSSGSLVQRILGYKFPLNNSVSAQSAEDKVAAYTILSSQGIDAIPHLLVRTKSGTYSDWVSEGWSDIVVKPLVGTSGHGIKRFHDATNARDWILQQPDDGWAVSPFVDIKREVRVVILDQSILLVYEKIPVTLHGLPMFNLGLGATPRNIPINTNLATLAKKASQALQLRLCAVDIVELSSGEFKVLEVNDGIMMEHYARVSPKHKASAYKVYEAIVDAIMK